MGISAAINGIVKITFNLKWEWLIKYTLIINDRDCHGPPHYPPS